MTMSRSIRIFCIAASLLGAGSSTFGQEAVSTQRISVQAIDGDRVMTVTSGDSTQQFVIPANPGSKTGSGATSIGAMPGGVVSFDANGKPQMMDMNELRQRAINQLKEQLGSSDDEWAVLQPKIEKIQALTSDAGAPTPKIGISITTSKSTSEVAAKQQLLRQAIQNGAASDSELKQKIAELRNARAQARQLLAKARQELADLVTSRQEAILIDRGILD